MKPRGSHHFLPIGLIVFSLLVAAGGRTYAAPASASATPPPVTVWTARELDPILIEGGWGGVVRVWVQGQYGLPVTIRSEDGSWSTANFVGSKPEYGADALEFAPVWPGRYVITPDGLGVSHTLDLAAGHVARVRFEPSAATRPQLASTPAPTPSPAQALALSPFPPTRPPLSAPATLGPAPALLEPPDGTAVSLRIRMDLAWTWDGSLGPDDYFRVEIWNKYDDFKTPIDVAWVKALTYRSDGGVNPIYDTEYRWKITVIRGIPPREKDWSTPGNQVWEPSGQYVPISHESDTWKLIVDPVCPPGDRTC